MARKPKIQIDWYEDELRVELGDATRKAIWAVALQIEAEAKLQITRNGQVDTGFMRNSVYADSDERSTYNDTDPSGKYRSSKQGRTVEIERAPKAQRNKDDMLVGVAAEYAVYQEIADPFLVPAVEHVAGRIAEETIVRVVKL